jgi:hypothetical protein
LSISATIAAGATLLGSLLPWASITFFLGTISVAGTRVDGKYTALLAIAAGILTIVSLNNRNRGPMLAAAILLTIAAAVAVWDLADIGAHVGSLTTDEGDTVGSVDIGVGLYLCTAGSIAGAILAFMALPKLRRPEPSSST